MANDAAPVLVTGATGRQGGATARALLSAGMGVRALVRDATSSRARAVQALGAELVTGDLRDRDSIQRAATGTRAVFSVQMPEFTAAGVDFDGEVAQGNNLVHAAREAGVEQFVHTSVSGAGQHASAPGWAQGRWAALAPTYEAKATIQDRVRSAGFMRWTLIKPAFFMDNFLPSAAYMFPRGLQAGLIATIKPDTHLSLVAAQDIGAAAASAFATPERFHQVELELASDYLTMTQVAQILSQASGIEFAAPQMTEEEALAAGMPPMGASQEWLNVVGQPARPRYAQDFGIPTTSFVAWAQGQTWS